MARTVKLTRGTGITNVMKDRYLPVTATKGFFGYSNQQTHFNSGQLLIDSSALLITSYLLKELAPSVKFIFSAGRSVATLSYNGAATAISNMKAALEKPNQNQTDVESLRQQLKELQEMLNEATRQAQ